jgi:hypothetical protein
MRYYEEKHHLIVLYVYNAHNAAWGSNDCNSRGKPWWNYYKLRVWRFLTGATNQLTVMDTGQRRLTLLWRPSDCWKTSRPGRFHWNPPFRNTGIYYSLYGALCWRVFAGILGVTNGTPFAKNCVTL